MTLVENLVTLPEPRVGNYEFARFNALRHGVLSQHTVLPWENGGEYSTLLEALVAEHKPQGPTEEHLVEELAGVIWRKRRLRMGENAAHHRALMRAADPYQDTAKAALIDVAGDVEINAVDDAIRATEQQTPEDRADLEDDQAMTEEALRILANPSPSAYSCALAALRDDTRTWWEEQLGWNADDYEEDQVPYAADAASLRRFLEAEILAWYEKRRQELEYRPLIRAQAFGEAVDPNRLERLARYEVHLDRKLERMLAMLFKLQELRRTANPT
jgi:FAD/FMN-containing dehydrogenase